MLRDILLAQSLVLASSPGAAQVRAQEHPISCTAEALATARAFLQGKRATRS